MSTEKLYYFLFHGQAASLSHGTGKGQSKADHIISCHMYFLFHTIFDRFTPNADQAALAALVDGRTRQYDLSFYVYKQIFTFPYTVSRIIPITIKCAG